MHRVGFFSVLLDFFLKTLRTPIFCVLCSIYIFVQISKNIIFEKFCQYFEIWSFHKMICVSQSKTTQALSIAVLFQGRPMFWDFSFEQILITNTTQKFCEEFKLWSSQFFVPIFWKMEKSFSFGFIFTFFSTQNQLPRINFHISFWSFSIVFERHYNFFSKNFAGVEKNGFETSDFLSIFEWGSRPTKVYFNSLKSYNSLI